MPHICLTMIVKNEARNILRCLNAARAAIDSLSICDTGSSDNTMALIQGWASAQGLPLALHQQPFVDFGHNRTLALELAQQSFPQADYCLLLDADMLLQVQTDWDKSALQAAHYLLLQRNAHIEYWNTRLVSARLPWRCVGVTHEYWESPALRLEDRQQLQSLWIDDREDGGHKAHKFQRDLALLENALQNPQLDAALRCRYVFYLAQTHRDLQQHAQALHYYRERAAAGGWEEERWYALFQQAVVLERIAAAAQADNSEVPAAFLAAWQARPSRIEPLVELARYYRQRQQYHLAFIYAQHAASLPMTGDILFVDAAAYQWRALDELSIAAAWALRDSTDGQPYADAGVQAMRKLLQEKRYPAHEAARIAANAAFLPGL